MISQKLILCLLTCLLSAPIASAATHKSPNILVQLAVPTFGGNGCPQLDGPPAFDAEGRVYLPGLTQKLLGLGAFSRFCRMTSVISGSEGHYFSAIKSWIGFSGQKSLNNAVLKIAVTHSLLGQSIKNIESSYPDGTQFNSPSMREVLSAEVDLSGQNFEEIMCQRNSTEGIFQTTVSVNGVVDAENGFLNFNETTLPLKLKVELYAKKCPLRN